MDIKRLLTTAAIAGAIFGVGLYAGARSASPTPEAKAPDKKAIAEMVRRMSAPATEHRVLAALAGTFDQRIEYSAGGGAPVIIEGDAEGGWVLGQRFIRLTARADAGEELKFESVAYFGFDTAKRKYLAIGLDTGGTYAVFAQGDFDAAQKRWVLDGESDEPGIGRVPFQFVITLGDNGSWSHEVLFKMPDADGYSRVAKTVYTRK